MSTQAMTYVVTRPKVLFPALIGLALLLGKLSVFWGLALVTFALISATRMSRSPLLSDLVRLRSDKRRHRIGRLLNHAEREEVLAIDRYATELEASGADAKLVNSTRERTWEIVREHPGEDASAALHAFRVGLPPLSTRREEAGGELAGKIQRELDILRATSKEMESLELKETEEAASRA